MLEAAGGWTCCDEDVFGRLAAAVPPPRYHTIKYARGARLGKQVALADHAEATHRQGW